MKSIIEWLREAICEPCTEPPVPSEPYPQQESTRMTNASTVVGLFDDPAGVVIKVGDLHITDRDLKLVDINHLIGFLVENPVSEREYIKGKHDCDDFAYILQGDITRWDSDLAFGIIHGINEDGDSHAWNVCIGTDGNIWFIEPQDDDVWKPDVDHKIYLVVM